MTNIYSRNSLNRIIFFLIIVGVLTLCGCANSDTAPLTKNAKKHDTQAEYTATNPAGTSLTLDFSNDTTGVATFNDVRHPFILDMPDNTEHAPLVIMLHGYGESAESFRKKTAFEADATPLGYVVCYVTGAADPGDKTSATGWNSGLTESGNDDISFLCYFASALCDQYSLDSERVFAVGFSNGAFMTHRLALEASDTFAAVVSVAGMMPKSVWDRRTLTQPASLLQITGEKDDVIPKLSDGSAKYSQAPAIEDVLDYYVEACDLTFHDTFALSKKATLEKHSSPASKKQVWNLFIEDGRHSWPDEKIVAVNINKLILEFLGEN